ncbi:MAG: hypothetical protein HY908_27625 [Myxococcales bacterium]|nr:hypothetical protein [Myxococcales bacterium]
MLSSSREPTACRDPLPTVGADGATEQDELPTRITSIASLVRSAVELAPRDPYGARDMLRAAAEVLRQRASHLGGRSRPALLDTARELERAAASGDLSKVLEAAGA